MSFLVLVVLAQQISVFSDRFWKIRFRFYVRGRPNRFVYILTHRVHILFIRIFHKRLRSEESISSIDSVPSIDRLIQVHYERVAVRFVESRTDGENIFRFDRMALIEILHWWKIYVVLSGVEVMQLESLIADGRIRGMGLFRITPGPVYHLVVVLELRLVFLSLVLVGVLRIDSKGLMTGVVRGVVNGCRR